ncbi:YncE family protein [Actinoplanes sp. CA-252034]|uniref:YncE family protein n=1 Tax=Actinoplanes sp. CA-252034 TaxID=3239906 RepID=UPI003D9626D9
MRFSRPALAATVLIGATAVAFGASLGSASAASRSLAVSSVGDVEVDGVHDRLFLSDPASGAILATDYEGNEVGRLTGLPKVRGLALSADSGTLYAAVYGAKAIVAYSTSTLAETARLPLGDAVHPNYVTVAGGRLWFGYDADTDFVDGGFGSVEASSGTVHLHQLENNELYHYAPTVHSTPAAPGVLVVADEGISSGQARAYDVSGGDEARTATGAVHGTDNRDFAFSPDGTRLIRLGGGVWTAPLSDLGFTQILPNYLGVTLDVAADGRIALADDTVQVYEPGATTAAWTVDIPGDRPVIGGLLWEPGADRLFAVTEYYDGRTTEFTLHSITEPPPAPEPSESTSTPVKGYPAVTVTAPEFAETYKPLTVKGSITLVPVGTELTVTRTLRGASEGTVIGTVRTGANGVFSLTDTPTAAVETTYTVSLAAGEYAAASASAYVMLNKPTPSLTVTAPKYGAVNNYGATVTITAKLGATHSNRVVEIWADPWDSQPNRLLKKGTVDSKGTLTTTLKLTRNTDIQARFAGDDRYNAVVDGIAVYTRVTIATTVRGHVKTKKVGSAKYYVFKNSLKRKPRFDVALTRHTNRMFRITLQRWSGGKWKTVQSQLLPAENDGTTLLELSGKYPAGTKLRMRPDYVRRVYGENNNHPTNGTWVYLTFVK